MQGGAGVHVHCRPGVAEPRRRSRRTRHGPRGYERGDGQGRDMLAAASVRVRAHPLSAWRSSSIQCMHTTTTQCMRNCHHFIHALACVCVVCVLQQCRAMLAGMAELGGGHGLGPTPAADAVPPVLPAVTLIAEFLALHPHVPVGHVRVCSDEVSLHSFVLIVNIL